MDEEQKILGMTRMQIGILAGMVGVLILIVAVGGWFVFRNLSGGGSLAPQQTPSVVPSVTSFVEKIPPTVTPTITLTPVPYEQLIPADWKQYKTSLVEIWLPKNFTVASKKTSDFANNFFASELLMTENFVREHDPEIILQFGRTPTSSVLESFLEETNANRYLINSYGDKFDPTRNAKATLPIEPQSFCESLIPQLQVKIINRKKFNWIRDFIKAEEIGNSIKAGVIERSKFPNEPSIITEIFKSVPAGSNIFIGNSLPVRDLDNFTSITSKRLIIHFNRGASGIDGVTSTALGMATRKRPAVLITGDLSFLHDLNALAIAYKYSIPPTIILINNNGGGIFESLPIANRIKNFNKFFTAPHPSRVKTRL